MKLNYYVLTIFVLVCALLLLKNCNAHNQQFLDGSPRIVSAAPDSTHDNNCLFCRIIKGIEPAKIIAENNDVLIFETIHPRHATHALAVLKVHNPNLKFTTPLDESRLGRLLLAVGALGRQLEMPQAFNIAINEGTQAGQTVWHIHLHVTSSSKLTTNRPQI